MNVLIEFKNLRDLEKSLKDEKTCRNFYEQTRWEGNVCCPLCGSVKVYTLKPNAKNNNYKCGEPQCAKKFNCLTGTIFHGTQLPLIVWFKAMYLVATLSKGISSPDLAAAIGVTQKTDSGLSAPKIMTEQEQEQFKTEFQSIVGLNYDIDKFNKQLKELHAWDKNGSHSKAIVKVLEKRQVLLDKRKESLKGRQYEDWKIFSQKLSRLRTRARNAQKQIDNANLELSTIEFNSQPPVKANK